MYFAFSSKQDHLVRWSCLLLKAKYMNVFPVSHIIIIKMMISVSHPKSYAIYSNLR